MQRGIIEVTVTRQQTLQTWENGNGSTTLSNTTAPVYDETSRFKFTSN